MFEIIMLFAFLYAAASQLFPAGPPPATGAPSDREPRHGRQQAASAQSPEQKRQSAHALHGKTEDRRHDFARAA